MSRDPRQNPGLAAKLEEERRLKAGISAHKTGLPPKLLALFEPRPPLERLDDIRKRPAKVPFNGIGQYVHLFASPEDPEYGAAEGATLDPDSRKFRNPELRVQAHVSIETQLEKRERLQREREEKAKEAIASAVEDWDPKTDPNAEESEAYNTLFVSRINFETTEKKLKREFEEFGPIKRLRVVHDKEGKSRGYAFIEFEHKADMKEAYKRGDGRKIEGKRVVVDVERGRTTQGWRPRRLGGGKGGEGREPREPRNPAKRLKAGLPPVPGLGGGAGAADRMAASRPPPAAMPPRDRGTPASLPPRPSARENGHREAPPPSRDRDAPRDRDKDRERERSRHSDRDRDRKRDRESRDRDDRDHKRHRDAEGDRSRKRERDLI